MAKWIDFVQLPSTGKTEIWQVVAKDGNQKLGTIKWFTNWRQYAFFPEPNTVFEKTCMADISEKIQMLTTILSAQRTIEKLKK